MPRDRGTSGQPRFARIGCVHKGFHRGQRGCRVGERGPQLHTLGRRQRLGECPAGTMGGSEVAGSHLVRCLAGLGKVRPVAEVPTAVVFAPSLNSDCLARSFARGLCGLWAIELVGRSGAQITGVGGSPPDKSPLLPRRITLTLHHPVLRPHNRQRLHRQTHTRRRHHKLTYTLVLQRWFENRPVPIGAQPVLVRPNLHTESTGFVHR